MSLHPTTFEYLKPSPDQLEVMDAMRAAAANYAAVLDNNVPDGDDKTYALRKLREVSMWVMIAISRQPDGSPRC